MNRQITTPNENHADLIRRLQDQGIVPRQAGRWRRFTREQIASRGDNLDIGWLKDDRVGNAPRQRDDPALVARLTLRERNAAVTELLTWTELLDEDPELPLEHLLPGDDASAGAVA